MLPPTISTRSNLQDQKRGALPAHMQHPYGSDTGVRSGSGGPRVVDRTNQNREGLVADGYGQSDVNVSAGAKLPRQTDRSRTARADTSGPIPLGLANWRTGVDAPASVPTLSGRRAPQREQGRQPGEVHFRRGDAEGTGSHTLHAATHAQKHRGSDMHTVEAGALAHRQGGNAETAAGATAMPGEFVGRGRKFEGATTDGYKGAASAPAVGGAVYGEQTQGGGRRAGTGNIRPGVTVGHGGANDGSSYHPGGVTARGAPAFDTGQDRTTRRSMNGESSRARGRVMV
jgi:hypothetical protein